MQRTCAALDQLAAALTQTRDELDGLVSRTTALREQVELGGSLASTMAGEERPLVVTRLTAIVDRLHETGSALRRAEAQQLRAEGLTQDQIADVFGVTRQRAAALLKPPPAGRPHRPR